MAKDKERRNLNTVISKKHILLMLIVLLGILIFLCYQAKYRAQIQPRPLSRKAGFVTEPRRGVSFTGHQIARELYGFLESLSQREETFQAFGIPLPEAPTGSPRGSYDGSPAAATAKVKSYGQTNFDLAGSDPHAISAWRILAHAGIFSLTGDTKVYERMRLNQIIWLFNTDTVRELSTIHQLFEAYRLTKYRSSLFFFWERLHKLKIAMGGGAIPPLSTRDNSLEAVAATFARELAQGAIFLGDKTMLEDFSKTIKTPSANDIPALKQDLIFLARRLLIFGQEKSANYELGNIVDGTNMPNQLSCFSQWANIAIFEATGEAQYIDKVVSFFDLVSFPSRRRKEIHFDMLHSALACLHSLLELSKYRPKYLADFRALMESVILPLWDSKASPVCDGDNGLISTPRTLETGCDSYIKTATDSAWLSFILSHDSGEYELK